jgi:hypothetical protein
MAFLLLLTYFVLSACFINPSSACRQALVLARNSVAAQGGLQVSATMSQAAEVLQACMHIPSVCRVLEPGMSVPTDCRCQAAVSSTIDLDPTRLAELHPVLGDHASLASLAYHVHIACSLMLGFD